MTTAAIAAFGVTLTRDSNTIAQIDEVGGIKVKLGTKEVTAHDSANAYREYIATLNDSDPVSIKGRFKSGDTNGQIGLLADLEAKTLQSFVLTFPTSITATWTFSAYVVEFETGGFPVDGEVPFSASLRISGKPTLAVTASAGLSALAGIQEAGSAVLDLIPDFLIGTFVYTVAVAAASTFVKFTPTGASHTITITNSFDSSVSIVATGNQSGELDLGAVATITTFTIKAQEAAKVAKTYTVHVTRAAS